LNPAFTVSYIDHLEEFFQNTVRCLLRKYQDQMSVDEKSVAKKGLEADLMDDLHNVALDMCVHLGIELVTMFYN
jgi:hypothetical protein